MDQTSSSHCRVCGSTGKGKTPTFRHCLHRELLHRNLLHRDLCGHLVSSALGFCLLRCLPFTPRCPLPIDVILPSPVYFLVCALLFAHKLHALTLHHGVSMNSCCVPPSMRQPRWLKPLIYLHPTPGRAPGSTCGHRVKPPHFQKMSGKPRGRAYHPTSKPGRHPFARSLSR